MAEKNEFGVYPKKAVQHLRAHFDTEDEARMFISLIQIFIASIAFLITLYNIHLANATVTKQINFQLNQKQTDMTFRYQSRYEHVITDLKQSLLLGKVGLDDYLYAYWGVQCDQYAMRCNGGILAETFDTWMRYRCASYQHNDTFYYRHSERDSLPSVCTYREGFDRAMKNYDNVRFERFFRDSIFSGVYIEKLKNDSL